MSSHSSGCLQVKVTLRHVRPPIWRRLVVPTDLTMRQFHAVIQTAMGWYDCHLHAFDIGGIEYGVPDPENWGMVEIRDDSLITLGAVAAEVQRFRYTYDFGDDWQHDILIEKSLPAEPDQVPRCIGGRRACPPEDVGGAPGYAEFLAAMADPQHERHSEYAEWIDEPSEPDAFDAAEVTEALRRRASR